MTNQGKLRTTLCLFIAITIAALSGCAQPPEQPMKEAPPPVAEAAPPALASQPEPEKAVEPPPATIAEARAAIERVYKDAVSMDANYSPNFVVGDFNGDKSQDIAIVVRPAKEKLADINDELSSWMIRDPLSETLPELMVTRASRELKPRSVITERDELLLAVIHGHGQPGWRNPEAQQTYLLKSAVGKNIKSETKKNLLKTSPDKRPPLIGDVVSETIAGQRGFIFYTGATYAWYDSRYYKAEMAKRMPH
jgi:hypothetical protein